jgi:2-oxoglutarate ferredoxin oxidoreductase subunit gamma
MQKEAMFAGFGGQGVLMMGKLLAHTAMQEGYEVAWVPSYGPEMRGGTANCTVVISDQSIGSPIIHNPMYLVSMNRPSLEKFGPLIKTGGIAVINSSLIPVRTGRKDIDEFCLPANEIAGKIGNVKAANVVALGALVARSGLVDFTLLTKMIKKEFGKNEHMIRVNLQAATEGLRLA